MTSGTYGGITLKVGASVCGGTTEKFGTVATWTGNDYGLQTVTKPKYGWRHVDYEKTVLIKGKRTTVTRSRRFRVVIGTYTYTKRVIPLGIEPHAFTKTWNVKHEARVGWKTPLASPSTGIAPWCFGGTAEFASPWGVNDTNSLVNKLGNKVKGSDFNLASTIGAEGKDTLKFIAETASRVARSLQALKRGNVNKAKSILMQDKDLYRRKRGYGYDDALVSDQLENYRNVANEFFNGPRGRKKNDNAADRAADSWLSWQLAAAPLLGDAKAAAEQLAQRYGAPQVYRQKASDFKVISLTPTNTPGAKYRVKQTRTDQSLIYYYSEPLTVPQLSGVLDPEIVLWNGTPWSFVADWFLPIGDWLEARGNASNLSGKFVLSVKTVKTLSGLYGVTGTSGGGYSYIDGKDTVVVNGSFVRSLPPSLTSLVRPPTFVPLKEALSWKKATTAIALGFSAFRSGSFVGNYLN